MSAGEMTIAEFVEVALKTENVRGKVWLEEHIKALGATWETYSHCQITHESADFILYGIAARVTFCIRRRPDAKELGEIGRNFLEEVFKKAENLGLSPSRETLLAIIMPLSPHHQEK